MYCIVLYCFRDHYSRHCSLYTTYKKYSASCHRNYHGNECKYLCSQTMRKRVLCEKRTSKTKTSLLGLSVCNFHKAVFMCIFCTQVQIVHMITALIKTLADLIFFTLSKLPKSSINHQDNMSVCFTPLHPIFI